MLFMDMAFISYSIYVPLFIFMYLIEILVVIRSRKKVFYTSFYKIFIVLSVVNISACLVGSFVFRLQLYPIVNSFYEGLTEFSPWLTASYSGSYYLNCLSEFLGLFMAFNRFTTMYFPLTHDKIWRRGLVVGYIVCIAVSFIPVRYLFGDTNNFVEVVDTQLNYTWYYLAAVQVYPEVSIWFNMVFVTVMCNTLSFLLYSACIIRLCLFSISRNHRAERNFFLVGFITMICSIPYMIAMMIIGLNLSIGAIMDRDLLIFTAYQLPWLTDLKYLTPAPMLLITNSSIRRAIKSLILLGRKKSSVMSMASQVSHSPRSYISRTQQ